MKAEAAPPIGTAGIMPGNRWGTAYIGVPSVLEIIADLEKWSYKNSEEDSA